MEAVRRLQFCCGHRVLNHESKCANAHGHNYVIYIHAKPKSGLDAIGRVIDFSVIKEIAGDWIDKYWDHSFLINEKDIKLVEIQNVLSKNKPCFICPFNPTAENMAQYLLRVVFPDLFKDEDIEICKIELFETENCKVVVEK